MKTIGLIGGMSVESTAIYYRLINEDVRKRLGGHHSAKLILWSVDFAEIEAMQRAGAWDKAGADLAEAARRLEGAGADAIVITANTMHIVADAVAGAVKCRCCISRMRRRRRSRRTALQTPIAACHALHDGTGVLPGALEKPVTASTRSCPMTLAARLFTTSSFNELVQGIVVKPASRQKLPRRDRRGAAGRRRRRHLRLHRNRHAAVASRHRRTRVRHGGFSR